MREPTQSMIEFLSEPRIATFDDPYLLGEPAAVPGDVAAVTEHPARFHLMVLKPP
jgi:hypothetical protein